uniref:Mutant cadherin n=1 Tax=Heliothis virescens TaxID=7102 RepID=A0A2A4JJZ9_HELVI
MSDIVKCSSCNIVISEVLAFIQNQVDVMNEESIVRLCATAFSCDEIVTAKDLLYQSVQTKEKKVKRKGKSEVKVQRDLEDIISLIKCTAAECIPIFVARELRKLPPVTFDHIDVTRLLKDIITVKTQIEAIREEYATVEQVNKLNMELINLKQASLVDGYRQENNFVNTNRGTRNLLRLDNFDLNSGPIGIMNLSKESSHTPEPLNIRTADCKMSLTDKLAQGHGNGVISMSSSHAKPRSPSVLVEHESTSCQEDQSKRVEAPTAVSSPVTKNILPACAHAVASASRVTGASLSAEPMSNNERRTYLQIAQDGGKFKTYKDEEWNIVQSKRLKNRFIGTQGKAKYTSGKFKAAESKIPLFVNNVDSESSVKDIADYILSKTSVVVQLTEIKMKRQRDYKAFKIFVPRHKLEIFLDEQLWPEGITFRRFINFKERNMQHSPSSLGDNKVNTEANDKID